MTTACRPAEAYVHTPQRTAVADHMNARPLLTQQQQQQRDSISKRDSCVQEWNVKHDRRRPDRAGKEPLSNRHCGPAAAVQPRAHLQALRPGRHGL